MRDDKVGLGKESTSGVSRRTVMKGAAWAVPALAVATAAPAYASSCVEEEYNALARGKMLSGGLFDINLDTLASVDGVIASAPTTVTETGFIHAGPAADPDVHANPVSVTALGAINVNATGLTTTVSQLLGILASADVGTLNQYGYAGSNGYSRGASGYVDDNGAVRVAPGGGYPQIATLNLKDFLTPLLGSPTTGFLANVTDLDLEVGAVVGRAILEELCTTVAQPDGHYLTREYLVSYLRLVLTSPLVGGVVTAVSSGINNVNLAVDTTALLNALGQIPLLGPVVTALLSLAVTQTVNVTANVGNAVAALTGTPIGTGGAIVTDLNGGTVTIDVATLLGSAFPGGASAMANSLPANSTLFVDYPLPTSALSDNLALLQDEIISRIAPHVSVTIALSALGGLTAINVSGSLADLLAGTATISASLGGLPVGGLGLVTNVALETVGALVSGALLATGGVINNALVALNGLLASIFDALANILNITLNVQNLPAENNAPAMPNNGAVGDPSRWTSGGQALPSGRYDVAALGISAVGLLNLLDLYIARGSVGPSTTV